MARKRNHRVELKKEAPIGGVRTHQSQACQAGWVGGKTKIVAMEGGNDQNRVLRGKIEELGPLRL